MCSASALWDSLSLLHPPCTDKDPCGHTESSWILQDNLLNLRSLTQWHWQSVYYHVKQYIHRFWGLGCRHLQPTECRLHNKCWFLFSHALDYKLHESKYQVSSSFYSLPYISCCKANGRNRIKNLILIKLCTGEIKWDWIVPLCLHYTSHFGELSYTDPKD